MLSQEGAPPASADYQEPWAGGDQGRGKLWLRQRVPRPGARGAPTPAGGVPTHWGTWRGSEHFLGLRCLRSNVPCCAGERAPLRRRSLPFYLPQGSGFPPLAPRAGRAGRLAAGSRPRGPPATRHAFALQCASRDDWRCARSMHEFSAKDIDGRMVNLDKYRWVPAHLVEGAGRRSGP